MNDCINVEIAEMKIARAPFNLVSIGIGSCVGVCLYDPVARLGGLAHIMLPDSHQSRNPENKAKFADTAIPALIADMVAAGAIKNRIVAKIAGGAQMFAFPQALDYMRIGDRNVQAAIEALRRAGIPLIARDTGSNYGRSIRFSTLTGKLYIKTIAHGEKVI